MRILYFYQYFCTPQGSWGTRVYDFASAWVKQGHKVTVVTTIYSKSDIKARRFIETQNFEGINVKIINILIDNKHSIPKRILTFILYAFFSSYYALKLPADVVIASSGPITVGLPGLVAHYFRKRKLVFEVRDLWPHGAIELGIIKNKFVIKLSYWFEKKIYKASSLIVCLSPGMKDFITSRFSYLNVISITNGANIALFSKPQLPMILPELGNRKYAIYTGNIGKVNDSDLLLETAKELRRLSREDIVILLIGDGQLHNDLLNKAKILKLNNFIIHKLMPKTELVGLVQNAIASIVPLFNTPVLQTSSPNKFFESIAAGVPVIQNTSGWMKKFLEENQIGFTIEPGNAVQLAELLIKLADNPEINKSIKTRAVKVAEENFDKNKLAERMLKALSEI